MFRKSLVRRAALTKLQTTLIAVIVCAPATTIVCTLLVTRRETSPLHSRPREMKLGNMTKTRSIVKVEAEGVALHFQNESIWKEDQL